MYIIAENIHIISPRVKQGIAERDAKFFQDLAVKSMAADIALDLSDRTASRVELRSEGIGFGAEVKSKDNTKNVGEVLRDVARRSISATSASSRRRSLGGASLRR